MPTYNGHITREGAAALETVDKKIVNEIFEGVVQGSQILGLMTKLPAMTSSQERIAILNSLPDAYWVSGDEGLKQTTSMLWANKYLKAEEIAVIVPISENVLADSDYDIWAEVKPRLVEAIYKKIDQAIITGTDAPSSFPDSFITAVTKAGNVVTATTDLYKDISDAMGLVEADGFDVNGLIGGVGLKKTFREGFRDKNGQPLNASEVTELPRSFVKNGAWDDSEAKMIVGDFKQAVYSFRQDMSFKLFTEGVVTDNAGKVIYNLMQNDMVALRVVCRFAWQLPNPVNALNSDAETRYPFAVIKPAA